MLAGPPPRLTPREVQILPYIIAGSRRSEIAVRFGRSEDTIKAHISNIVRKFSAKSTREAFEDIHYYFECFGLDGTKSQYYTKHLKTNLTLDASGTSAKLTERYSCEVLFPCEEQYKWVVWTDCGYISNAEIDGQPAQLEQSALGGKMFVSQSKNNYCAFEKFYRTTSLDYVSAFPGKSEFWTFNVMHKIVEFELHISFENCATIPQLEGLVHNEVGQLAASRVSLPVIDKKATWKILDPLRSFNYSLVWTWEGSPAL